MIETSRAELWAVSVAIDGFATFGVLACPVCDFLDEFLVWCEKSLVRRLCRYAGVLMVHRGSLFALAARQAALRDSARRG